MKTAKRFAMLAGLALALMAVLSFTGCSKKGEIAKVAPESDFEFKLSEDGTFIKLTKYNGNAEHLVIPETIQGVPVEVIGMAFGGCENNKMKSVVIPSSVKVIGNNAFGGYASLEEVTLPEKLLRIDGEAFSRCESLEKVTLPEELLYIEAYAFSNTGLTSVTLPKSLEYMGKGAFFGCNNLAEINIPDDAAFLLKNATECAEVLDKYYSEEEFTNTGDDIFSGSIIDESVALQKKLKEIKCIKLSYARKHYSKFKEICDETDSWLY